MDNAEKILYTILLIAFSLMISALLTQAADGLYLTSQLKSTEETTEAEQVIVKCLYCGCWHHEDSDVYYESIALS